MVRPRQTTPPLSPCPQTAWRRGTKRTRRQPGIDLTRCSRGTPTPSRSSKIDYEIADQTSRRTKGRLYARADSTTTISGRRPRWCAGLPDRQPPRGMRFDLVEVQATRRRAEAAIPTTASRVVVRYPQEQPTRCSPPPRSRGRYRAHGAHGSSAGTTTSPLEQKTPAAPPSEVCLLS
jgi:hypothetical protein